MEKFTDAEMVSMKLARYNEMITIIQDEKQKALFDRQIRDQLENKLKELGYRLVFYRSLSQFNRDADNILVVTTEQFSEYEKLETDDEIHAWLIKAMRKEAGL